MQIKKKRLTVFDQSVGVFEVGFSFADGFDLSAAERHTGLDLFEQEVVVAGCSILCSIAVTGSNGVPWPDRLLRAGFAGWSDDVTGLSCHWTNPLNLHRSIGLKGGETKDGALLK